MTEAIECPVSTMMVSTMNKKILKLIEKRGIEVFGNKEKLILWMNCPCKALNDKTPTSLLKKSEIEMILDELGRIENGVFA